MRVLVTRPEPAASRTAQRLRHVGHEPVVLPLSRIVPIPARASGAADAVAATSANAIRHAARSIIEPLVLLPLFAVGEATAAAAREAGFADIRTGATDAAALAGFAGASLPPGARIVYLCGRVRKPDFERSAAAMALVVETSETYDTIEIGPDEAELDRVAAAGRIDAVLVYSPNAARAVDRLVLQRPRPFQAATAICLSPEVSAALGNFANRAQVAATPDEDALLAALDAMAERSARGGV